jgi:hypothetical protein
VTTQEVEKRLRAARPAVGASPPPLASVLAQIELAERTPAVAATPSGRSWWRGSRSMVPVLLAVLALGGAASAALLLATGKPLPPAYVLPANPQTGLGQPVAASVTPLPIRVPDPEGGPPWGMRVLRTTRGLVCLQGGRVVNGQLGGLGAGYAFGGDGRFHAFSPADAIATDACPAAGSDRLAFLPGPPVVVTANALPLAGENVLPGDQVHCDLPGQSDWGVRCPQSQLRQVAMGVLGPDVTSIEVTWARARFSVRPYGPDGAYLIVLPAQPKANASMSSGSWQSPFGFASSAPGGAVLTVTYKDGSHCQIPITNPQQQCHAKGAAPATPIPNGLRTDIRVDYVPLEHHPVAPLIADARGGGPSQQKTFEPASGASQRPGPALAVAFRAPVAAANASTAYVVELRPREATGCATPSLIVSQPSEQAVSAGQRVAITIPLLSKCATTYSGRVFLARSSSIGGESGGEGPLYEAIAAQFGGGPNRDPMRFPNVGRFSVSVP